MDVETTLTEVETHTTRGGNTRYVARGADGNEYTTFREEIGDAAMRLKGHRVRISYHEQQRGQYTNVYMDAVQAVESPASADTDAQEAAWRTAVEAAPWLVGNPKGEVAPDELYEKLKPFEERVAADIEADRRTEDSETA